MTTLRTLADQMSPYAAIQQGFPASFFRRKRSVRESSSVKPGPAGTSILTEEAARETALGTIPDLTQLCRKLNDTFLRKRDAHSALQFIPILQQVAAFSESDTERFLNNPKTNHILIQNDNLKVVLIRWEPGKLSSVHGHAQGGCVFKVLKGRLQEKRYTPDRAQQLLAVSNFEAQAMAYIDDQMAFHAVGNPFDEPAISIHAYTPGH